MTCKNKEGSTHFACDCILERLNRYERALKEIASNSPECPHGNADHEEELFMEVDCILQTAREALKEGGK